MDPKQPRTDVDYSFLDLEETPLLHQETIIHREARRRLVLVCRIKIHLEGQWILLWV